MRTADLARLTIGTLLVARPQTAARLTGTPPSGVVTGATRFLGSRYLVQGTAGSLSARRWPATVDASVEVIHAVSMVGLGLVRPRARRLTFLSAATACAFAVADVRAERGP